MERYGCIPDAMEGGGERRATTRGGETTTDTEIDGQDAVDD